MLKANVLIALGATLLNFAFAYKFLEKSVDYTLSVFVFFSTLGTYNLLRLLPLYLEKHSGLHDDSWYINNKKILLWMVVGAFAISGSTYLGLNLKQQLLVPLLGLLSLFYTLPVLGNKTKNMRAIPLVKAFLIAFVWACITVGLAWTNAFGYILSTELFKALTEVFLFILALAMVFDIRDYRQDTAQGLKTVPSILGVQKSKIMAIALVWSGFLLNLDMQSMVFALLASIAMWYSDKSTSDWYFLALLDGLIVLKSLEVLV